MSTICVYKTVSYRVHIFAQFFYHLTIGIFHPLLKTLLRMRRSCYVQRTYKKPWRSPTRANLKESKQFTSVTMLTNHQCRTHTEKFCMPISLYIIWVVWGSTVLFRKWIRRPDKDLGRSIVVNQSLVVITCHTRFKTNVRAKYLSLVHRSPRYHRKWGMRHFYESIGVFSTPDVSIMFVDGYIGVKNACIGEQDSDPVSGIASQVTTSLLWKASWRA